MDTLVADLKRIHAATGAAAFGFALVKGNETLWAGAGGIADRASTRPAGPDTVFRVGSITKGFTAITLLLAQADGALSLTDRLADRAPGAPLANPWSATDPVSLEQLLEHTAGLNDIEKPEWDWNDAHASLEQALAFMPQARVARWRPGEHSSYSNAGYGLAALALEKSTGRTWEDWMLARVLAPLGMATASVGLTPATAAQLATGYDSDGISTIPYWHMIFRPFAALNARPADMAQYLKMLLTRGALPGGGRLLSEADVARMEAPRTTLAARSGLAHGYGLGLYAWYHRGALFHGHGGDGDGYLAHIGYDRASGYGYFLVVNAFRHRDLKVLRERVEDWIAERSAAEAPRSGQVDARALASLTGGYRAATWRFPGRRPSGRLSVVLEKGRLWTVEDGERAELVPVTGRHFRRPGEPGPTIAFAEDKDGRMVVQGDLGNWVRQGKA